MILNSDFYSSVTLLRHCVLFCIKLCDTFTPLFQCSLLISVLQVMRSPVRLCDLFCMQLFFIMCDTSTLLFQWSLLISVLHFSFQVMSSEVLFIVTYAAYACCIVLCYKTVRLYCVGSNRIRCPSDKNHY